MEKECAEEAGIPPALAARARPVGAVSYLTISASGYKPDVLFCYDLELPHDFVPTPQVGGRTPCRLWRCMRCNGQVTVLGELAKHGVCQSTAWQHGSSLLTGNRSMVSLDPYPFTRAVCGVLHDSTRGRQNCTVTWCRQGAKFGLLVRHAAAVHVTGWGGQRVCAQAAGRGGGHRGNHHGVQDELVGNRL